MTVPPAAGTTAPRPHPPAADREAGRGAEAGQSADPGLGSPAEYPGAPDAFQRLWTPHRLVYIKGDKRPQHDGPGRDCPFCRAPGVPDAEALVVHRGTLVYAVLNLFPYNPGPQLICPYEPVADYVDLSAQQRAELGEETADAMAVLRAVSAPHGFNLGMNQGSVGGAGIAGHLHQHVVPRWEGDSNFLPIVAGTKALPELLADTREKLAAGWRDRAASGRGAG